jgi:hypothetical protein
MAAPVDPVRAIADAVLYEGYVLWPYRRSALKNQKRWTFGGVYPRDHSEGREDDPCVMQTQCLLEAPPHARVDVSVRFLHVVERQVAGRGAGGGLEPVDELTVAGDRHLSWTEAAEREIEAGGLALEELAAGHTTTIEIPAASEEEPLTDEAGERVGAIVRSWRRLAGTIEVRAEQPRPGLWRVTVRVANTTPFDGVTREQALERTFCSTHTVLRASAGEFVSQTDPPGELREPARACRNENTWPVLVGDAGERSTVLSSPIILEDNPRVAPESPGDLFDGGEIDQMLVLNILSLTDAERAEMRDSDPRTREILERTESLTPEQLMSLHGAIREFGMVRER